jgi:outer membrane protein TolC
MKSLNYFLRITLILSGIYMGFSQPAVNGIPAEYLEAAVKNNPEIKAAFNRYLAAVQKIPQVSALPDPQATIGYFINPMVLPGGDQTAKIQLMQMFPWFGTLQSAKDEASMMAKAKYAMLNIVKADIYYRVKAKWYQLVLLSRKIDLLEENIQLLRSMENRLLVKFQSEQNSVGNSEMTGSESGDMRDTENPMIGMGRQLMAPNKTPSTTAMQSNVPGSMANEKSRLTDVFKIKMEILEQENQLALLKDRLKTEITRFNALLNREPDREVFIPDTLWLEILPGEQFSLADSIIGNNPEMAMLRAETQAYAQMGRKAGKMGLPMLGIGLEYMVLRPQNNNTGMMNGKDMIMPMLSLSLPIYRKKYSAMREEAMQLQAAASQAMINAQNNLRVQSRQIHQDLADAVRRLKLYKQQTNLARKTFDLLLTEFSVSRGDYEEVLRMQYKVLDYQFKHLQAIADYNTAVAVVEKLMNTHNE